MTNWHPAAWISGLCCLLIGLLIWQFRAHRRRVADMAAKLAEIHARSTAELTVDGLRDEHERTRAHITSVLDDGVRKDIEITKTRMDHIERMVAKIALVFGVKL